MASFISKINENNIFSIFYVLSLTSALFYTGNNTWLFTMSYILIVLSLTLVLKQRFSSSINISTNGVLISAAFLLLWFAISIFTSQIMYLSLYNFFWVGSFIIIFLIFTVHDNKDKIWINIWPAILLLVIIWAIYGLVQYYYLHVPTNASFLNRNSLAALINLALIPASAYFLLAEKDRPWAFFNNKLLAIALIILFLATFIITSRGATLSLILGFIILIILIRKQIEKRQFYYFLALIFISFLIAAISQNLIQDAPATFTDRMVSLQNTTTAGNSRFIIWKSLLPLFDDMPWYGLGLGSLWVFWPPYQAVSDHSAGFFAHNDYMQITLEAGYPGIILLLSLFLFIVISFIRSLRNSTSLTSVQRVELISLFAALTTFATHSIFTYNFYILPLLIIAGLYLGRFNQLANQDSTSLKEFSALKKYFKPVMFTFSLAGLTFILCSYFLAISLSSDYNKKAKKLMLQNKYQDANASFLKAQILAPIMDNPFFSHADLLRRGANKLLKVNKFKQANSLLKAAHENLDTAKKLNPLRPQIHHIRGLIFEQEQPEKAIVEFEKALKLNPRFLFSRIRLATLFYQQNDLKKALKTLYEGVDYNYPVNKIMLQYMRLFADYSREAGVESFALHLEDNIKKFTSNKRYNK